MSTLTLADTLAYVDGLTLLFCLLLTPAARGQNTVHAYCVHEAATMKRILLIRHAECDMNLRTKGFVGGQSNSSPLTPLGQQQAAALGRYLSQQYPTLHNPVYCSTAVRARDTAAGMLQQWQDQCVRCTQVLPAPQLLELSQGEWEGKTRCECYTPDVLAQIAADPWRFAAPGGESQQQLEERMVTFIKGAVLPSLQYDGPPAIIMTHGLAIKCFLRHVLDSTPGMTWKIENGNTSITEVSWVAAGPAAGWHLNRVNDTAHLALAGVADKHHGGTRN